MSYYCKLSNFMVKINKYILLIHAASVFSEAPNKILSVHKKRYVGKILDEADRRGEFKYSKS